MHLDRRTLLAGLGGSALALVGGTAPAQAATVTRTFDILRGDTRIGGQTLTVQRSGADLAVSVDVDIVVRILGLPAYRYKLTNQERWSNGVLQSLRSKTNDNGTRDFVQAQRQGNGVAIKGSAYSGSVQGNPGTTSYWTTGFFKRPVWINTQNGAPMRIKSRNLGNVSLPLPGGAVTAQKWRCTGDIGQLDLFYDGGGEWIGNAFEVKGQQLRFVVTRRGGNLAPLWRQTA